MASITTNYSKMLQCGSVVYESLSKYLIEVLPGNITDNYEQQYIIIIIMQ